MNESIQTLSRPDAETPRVLEEAPVADASVPRLELREWAERFGLVAGITTRGHGFSLGLWSAESVGQVMTRWRAFRAVHVTVADCIPIYLAVPQKGAIALLHAGWRGTAAGILERGVGVLRRQGFAKAADIVMHCGVGICGRCYEVGSEVAGALTGAAASASAQVDLRELLVHQAQQLGIGAVTVSPWCTAHDHDRFFSHRASGGGDGRQVAYLGSPLA